jgi:presenilin-like A22 family membrane protease
MFLLTQFIGLFVIQSDVVPTYLDSQVSEQEQTNYGYWFFQLVTALIFSILIFVFLTKYKLALVLRIWFFAVICIALSISILAILKLFGIEQYFLALLLAIPFAAFKVIRPSVLIHNGTELLIYPGIATIFVSILSPIYIIFLLILISIYDIWAVWHSGIMQRMAKFQMKEVKVFGGFYIPYLTKEIRNKIKLMKQKLKNRKLQKGKAIKIPVAILGGGDIVFPIITAGVFMNAYGLGSALAVIFGAFAGLLYLLLTSEKKKFYPAMPFITAGIFLGLALWALATFI